LNIPVANIEDAFWIPDEYNKNLYQLGEHLCIQNDPYLQLADKLRSHRFEGIMEIHVFVAPVNPTLELQEQFKKACSQYEGMKCCNLRLDFFKQGWVAVLMSSRYVRGTMDFIWTECFKDSRLLTKNGFDVIRCKIEATASIDGVPVTDSEALLLPKKTYFEFHMVFSNGDGSTPTDEDVDKVKTIARSLEKQWDVCIPVSTNSFGTQKFLNMRTYGIGRQSAYPRLELLGKHIENAGFKVPRFIREFGVYDSDVTIDAGWLEPPQHQFQQVKGFLPPIQV